MSRLFIFVVAIMLSTSTYSATGNVEYNSAVKNYQSRCQKGEYLNAKFEELKDIEQINIIGHKLRKSAFISACNNLQAPILKATEEIKQIPASSTSINDESLNKKNLPRCKNQSYDNCFGTLGPYTGEFQKGRYSGLGKFTTTSRSYWISEFLDDKKDGACKLYVDETLSFSGKCIGGQAIEPSDSFTPQKTNSKSKESYSERSNRIIDESKKYQESLKQENIELRITDPAGSIVTISTESLNRFTELRNQNIPIPNTNLNAVPPCVLDGSKRDNCLLLIFFDNGDAFFGAIKNGKIRGVGEWVSNADGKTYLGEFDNDNYEGIGSVYDNNTGQLIQQGIFKNGVISNSKASNRNSSFNWKGFAEWAEKYQEQERQRRGTSCTSTVTGREIRTHCY